MNPTVISEDRSQEPISLEDAGHNLRADDDGNSPPTFVEGTFIQLLIRSARQAVEQETGLSLIPRVLEVSSPNFFEDGQECRGYIELPGGPVHNITALTYIDTSGVEQTLDPIKYRIDRRKPVARIIPAYGAMFPDHRSDFDAVKVRYTAGYPTLDSPPRYVPEALLTAMHLLIGHGWKFREAVVDGIVMELPIGVRYWIDKYRDAALGV
jgi:uncharacterized phiE125 gp8 family phage protein